MLGLGSMTAFLTVRLILKQRPLSKCSGSYGKQPGPENTDRDAL